MLTNDRDQNHNTGKVKHQKKKKERNILERLKTKITYIYKDYKYI